MISCLLFFWLMIYFLQVLIEIDIIRIKYIIITTNKDENIGNTPFITAIEKKIDTIINNDNDNTVEEINISANSNKSTIQEVDTIENENETKTNIEEVTINEAENGDMFEDVKEYEIDEVVNDDDID